MRKRVKLLALILCCAMLAASLFACAPKSLYQTKYIFAMDTDIGFYINAEKDASELISECEKLIYKIEDTISKTRSGSDVYRLNSGETVKCSVITLSIIEQIKTVSAVTNGAFDPTVAGLVSMWQECEKSGTLPSEERLSHELSLVGEENIYMDGDEITLKNGAQIDLGGIGKGYAEQEVARLIEKNSEKFGVVGYMLDFGGMVAVFGEKPNGEKFKVGLKDPDDTSKSRGYVSLKDGYVSVSGDYERFVTVGGKKYHHIIDPKTGYPADSGLRSVAVISHDAVLADALSTAFFVMGYEKAKMYHDSGVFSFDAVFFFSDGTVIATDDTVYSD